MSDHHSADALKQCRDEFDAWHQEEHSYLFPDAYNDGGYQAIRWAVWQAAWNRRPTPAPTELRSDLEAINRAMQHMGDQLNEMDVVEEGDEEVVTPGFDAIARLLASRPTPAVSPDLMELRKLAEAATPGPWKVQHPNAGDRGWEVAGSSGLEQIAADLTVDRAAYIAAANPAAIIALLDRIGRAEAPKAECQSKPGEWSECQMRTIEMLDMLKPPPRRIERAEAAAGAVPEGFAIAPIEPTDEIIRAALAVESPATYRDFLRHPNNGPHSVVATERDIARVKKQYAAMLAAAPKAPIGAPTVSAEVPRQYVQTLDSIAEWLDKSTNMQQTGIDTQDYASEFDQQLAQAASELAMIANNLRDTSQAEADPAKGEHPAILKPQLPTFERK